MGKAILTILGKVGETNGTKGPLFIVYPFDRKPELATPTYYDRSAWQLQRLEIK